MPIETIEHNGNVYPAWQAEGFAAQFIFPIATKICKGIGVDVGCNRREWALPGAFVVDPVLSNGQYHATNFPVDLYSNLDFVFSSHCLEHCPDWVEALDYWHKALKVGGVLCLYLPHPDQTYWLPFHNRKHIHSLTPFIIERYLYDRGWNNIFVSQRDLNHSFCAIAEKGDNRYSETIQSTDTDSITIYPKG